MYSNAQDCAVKKDEDSIRVSTCAVAKTGFKSIIASFTIHAELSELAAVLMDIDNYTAWQFNTIKARIIEASGDRELIYYIEVYAPWPVTNRDLVVRFRLKQDSVTKVITITANSVPDFLPRVKGLVRVPSSASQWIITPRPNGNLAVAYSIQIDPGGSVPAWMANAVAANAPWESFRNLKMRMAKLRSSLKKLPYIVDVKE